MGEKFEFDGLPEAMKLEVLNRLTIQAKARIMLFSDCYRLLEDHMSTTIEKMKDPEERRKYSSNLEFVRKQSRYLIDKMLEGETVAVALHRWKKAGIFLVWIPFGQTQSRLSVILELGPKGILNFTKKDLLELLQPLFDCPLPSIPIVPLPLKSSGRPTESASAPPKGLGVKLGKRQRANQLLESLKAEGELIVEDVRPSIGQSKPATSPPSDPVTLTVEENINVTLKQDGGIENFHVQGTLSLHIRQDDGLIQIQIETGRNPGIQFRTPPNINKELFSGENILGLKDPNHPFPIGQAGDGVSLLKWRMHSADESLVPLSINCWPAVSANETSVTLEYKAPPLFDLQNVVISIPVPALREAPNVRQIDGDWRYDSRRSILEWYILLIDKSNRSGSMDFVIPAAVHTSDLFPIYVRFTSARTFSDVKVVKILPLKGGNPPKFSQSTLLSTGNYQLV